MKKLLMILLISILLTGCAKSMKDVLKREYQSVRQPAVAGQFYPAEARVLETQIKNYLDNVKDAINKDVKAIMVPHAGYAFSGQVAAYGFKQLEGRKIKTAIIICNSHSGYFSGIAIDENEAWQTPLGLVEVDHDLAKKLISSDDSINYNSQAHIPDHTLEVQLPFLQTIVEDGFKIVPILFGNTEDESYKKLAKALADNLGQDDVIIISTDMSHYPSYKDANRIDQETLGKIKKLDVLRLEEHIAEVESQNVPGEDTLLCGDDGVKTVMEMARLENWSAEILKYANSGDVEVGDKNSVVGYGSVVFSQRIEEEASVSKTLNQKQQEELLKIARETVENFVKTGEVLEFEISDEKLSKKQGAFVTLKKNGQLRGCIGQIVPTDKPLWQVVRDMAIAAATEDNRFSPVSLDELDDLNYEISVLSVPEQIDDWQKIKLGQHGVIVKKGLQSGVFLPQVAKEVDWGLEEFLSHLCADKAGLAFDCYKNDEEVELLVFEAEVF